MRWVRHTVPRQHCACIRDKLIVGTVEDKLFLFVAISLRKEISALIVLKNIPFILCNSAVGLSVCSYRPQNN